MQECILCFEEESIFGIGFCNHGPICFKCTIKCRTKMDSTKCPICKEEQKEIIMQVGFESFQSFSLSNLNIYEKGILYSDPQIKHELDSLNQIQCWVKNCKDDKKYNTIGFLKRHLKERHNRFLCDVCVENKTALLQEQKLYSQNGLDKHHKNGDYDDEGNLIFFHPYCQFCHKYFYSEEQFHRHVNQEHFSCTVCATQEKYRYYKDYKSLEIHFKMSHYLCMHQECLDKTYIVFRYQPEKEIHDAQYHGGTLDVKQQKNSKQSAKLNFQSMAGFHYEQNTRFQSNKEDKIVIKDNEGVDMENQYISQRKTHLKTVRLIEKWEDSKIDIRNFYGPLQEDEEDEETYFKKVWGQESRHDHKQKKDENEEEPEIKEQLVIEEEPLFFEDVRLVKYTKLMMLDIDKYDVKLQKILTNQQFEEYCEARTDYFKSKTSALEFFEVFAQKVGNKRAYQLFPYFITCIPNPETAQELDQAYYSQVLSLPKRRPSLLISCKTFSDILRSLQQNLDRQITFNVEADLTPVLQPLDQAKFSQLYELLKRVNTDQFCQLKYGSNFGISVKAMQFVKQQMYCSDGNISSLSVEDVNNLLLYVDWAISLVKNEAVNPAYMENRLYGYLERHPEIKKLHQQQIKEQEVEQKIKVSMFGKSKCAYKDKYVSNEVKEEKEVVPIKEQPKKIQEVAKASKAIGNDKFEFPGLGPDTMNITDQLMKEGKKAQGPQKLNNDWVQKRNQNPFLDYDRGVVKSTKELSEQFPGLEPVVVKKEPIIKQNINSKQQEGSDSEEEQESRGKGRKNKKKGVKISGFY